MIWMNFINVLSYVFLLKVILFLIGWKLVFGGEKIDVLFYYLNELLLFLRSRVNEG